MNNRRVVYNETQQQFFQDVDSKNFLGKMVSKAQELELRVSSQEQVSWANNAPKIKELLEVSGINDSYVTFEYLVPYRRSRIDCMIYGSDNQDYGNVVHIELKQWSNQTVKSDEIDANFQVKNENDEDDADYNIVALTGGSYKLESHPSQQVRGYDNYLTGFIEVLSTKQIGLKGIAYCYNYSRYPKKKGTPTVLYDAKYDALQREYRTYSKDELNEIAAEIREKLCHGNGFNIFNKMMNSKIRSSKKLLEAASKMIEEGNYDYFSLIEEQITAKNAIMDAIRKMEKHDKSVIIVKGGPGTGKTVIALSILAELAGNKRKQYNLHYATKSKPLLEGVRHQLKPVARPLFSNVLQFIPANFNSNDLDVLLVDEAHRITLSPNHQYTKPEKRTDMTMVDTLINCAKVVVFFIDDKQAIRSQEIGSTEMIRNAANRFSANIYETELYSQFRCNGSDNYLDWLDQIMYNQKITSHFKSNEFDFKIFDDPQKLYDAIKEQDNKEGQSARICAGFCWPWSDKTDENGDLRKEVEIGSFAMPWETKESIKPRPKGYVQWYEWAYKPEGIKQVGCIYTAQGFEFDYIGVIVGNDLRYDKSSGNLYTDITATKDPMLKRSKEGFDDYVRNIYRVLMSRGMKGCYVYFCDPEVATYFQQMMLPAPKEEEKVQMAEIVPMVSQSEQYTTYLPVFSMKAACGYFGEGELVEEDGWMKVDGMGKLNRNMFVVQASGRSMEPRIHDGDYCVFRAIPAGSRQGKIVLVQHRNFYDDDSGGAYSIKKYSSSWSGNESDGYQHEKIELIPLNNDYKTIVINREDIEDDEEPFIVIGEFVGVIN
ncbi:MAG: DUF2075 domain-containing protein [Prevotella sp.]|nr:DUF2075 domain-containing protein [Prevotella sp.]